MSIHPSSPPGREPQTRPSFRNLATSADNANGSHGRTGPVGRAAPRRLPWDDPYGGAPPPVLLYSSQFAAQRLSQEWLPEEAGQAPQIRHAGIATYRRHLPGHVAVIGPAPAAGFIV